MEDKIGDLERRISDIESRLMKLETGTKPPETVIPSKDFPSKSEEPSFPIGGVILLIVGGLILLSSLPNFLFNLGRSSSSAYLVPIVIGILLGALGLKSILPYRERAKKSSKEPSELRTEQVKGISGTLEIEKPPEEEQSLEFKLAANWFAIVGIVAIVFAVVFFLKFAFDNGLIGPVGQVVIGLVFGISLIFAGEFLREKVHKYSQIISSGGIVVLYLSIWAALGLFHLISPYVALASMSIITILSSLLAIRYEAVYIGVLGVIGGFATPILLGKGFDSEIVLMSYIVILNLGVLAVAFFKNWRELSIATFAGTYIVFVSWAGIHWKAEKFLETITFLTIIFLIFAISLFIYNFVYKKEAEESDIILMLLNALVYFGLGYYLMTDAGYKDFIGFFAFALAAFYFALGSLSYQKFKESSYLTLGFLGIAIFFLTIAVPLSVKKNLITIVWAVEAASLLLLGFLISSQKLRVAALIIYILVVIRLLAFDTQIDISQFTLIFNIRFLTFMISVISMGCASYLYFKYSQNLDEDEKKILPSLLIALNVLLIWVLSWESISYYGRKIDQFRNSRLQSLETDVRVLGIKIAQGINIYDTYPNYSATGSGQIERQPNNYQYYRYPSPTPYNRYVPRPNYNYQPPKTLTSQDLTKIKGLESARDISLSVIWLFYSVILLGIGIAAKYKPIRLFALAFLMLTIFKVFVYDSRNLQQGYRIVAFMVLGTILLATSLVYQKYKTQISAFLLNDK